MSISLYMNNFFFIVKPPENINDAAIQEYLKPLEKLETDIQRKIDAIRKENCPSYRYSLRLRAVTFAALKFAWTLGPAARYILNPLANATFEFTAKKLSVNAASSLFFRAIPWIVYFYALGKLNSICDGAFNYLVGSAIKSNEIFKAIRIVAELEKANNAYNLVCNVLDSKKTQINNLQKLLQKNEASFNPKLFEENAEKIQQQITKVAALILKNIELREQYDQEYQLSKANAFYSNQFVFG